MAHKFFEEKRPHNGLKYSHYMEMTEKQINETNEVSLGKDDREIFEYTKMNIQRSRRIEKHYEVSDELVAEIQKIDNPQLWMVITENWCGDSAQNLPYIAKMAEENSNINFRIILRDKNPDIMDLYLTNGTKSIPVLIAFDIDGNEIFKWGPRPAEAQKLILEWKSQRIVKPELYEKLHLWYGRDRGKEIEKEMLELIKSNISVFTE
jgi:hypothetical protein